MCMNVKVGVKCLLDTWVEKVLFLKTKKRRLWDSHGRPHLAVFFPIKLQRAVSQMLFTWSAKVVCCAHLHWRIRVESISTISARAGWSVCRLNHGVKRRAVWVAELWLGTVGTVKQSKQKVATEAVADSLREDSRSIWGGYSLMLRRPRPLSQDFPKRGVLQVLELFLTCFHVWQFPCHIATKPRNWKRKHAQMLIYIETRKTAR